MTASKRCACYVRVSTDRQQVENQLAELLQMVAARGYDPAMYEEVECAAKARPVLDPPSRALVRSFLVSATPGRRDRE